jgi:hypothetical protein
MAMPKSYLKSSLVSTSQHLNEVKQPYGDIFNAVKDDVYGPGPKSAWRYGLDVINIPKHLEFAVKLPVDWLDNALAPMPEQNLFDEQVVPAPVETVAATSQSSPKQAEDGDSGAGVGDRILDPEEQATPEVAISSRAKEKLIPESKSSSPVATVKRPIPPGRLRKTARAAVNVLRLPHVLIRSLTSPIKYFFTPLNELRKTHPKLFAAILITTLLVTAFVAVSVFSGGMPAFMLSIGLAATQAGTAMAAVSWLAWMGLAAAIIIAKAAFVAATFLISGKVLQAVATEVTGIKEYYNSSDRLDEEPVNPLPSTTEEPHTLGLTPKQHTELADYIEKYNNLAVLIPAASNDGKKVLDDNEKALAGYIVDKIKPTAYDKTAIDNVAVILKAAAGTAKIPFSLDFVESQERLQRIFANLKLINEVQKTGQEKQRELAEELKQRQANAQRKQEEEAEARRKVEEETKRLEQEQHQRDESTAQITGIPKPTQSTTADQEEQESNVVQTRNSQIIHIPELEQHKEQKEKTVDEKAPSLSDSWVFDLPKLDKRESLSLLSAASLASFEKTSLGNWKDNKHWYDDTEVTTCLGVLAQRYPDAEMLSPARDEYETYMPDNLLNVLESYKIHRARQTDPRPYVFIPVNVGGNHWTLLYLNYSKDDQVDAYYFNSMGDHSDESFVPDNIAMAVFDNYKGAKLHNISEPVQTDGYNCGPWIIWAVECILNGGVPTSKDDINHKRGLQQYLIEETRYLASLEREKKDRELATQLLRQEQAEEAKRKAENNAADRALEEAKRRNAEAEARKAEEEVRRKQEEARRKADEEQRQREEAEARRKAEEEQRKQEDEAERKRLEQGALADKRSDPGKYRFDQCSDEVAQLRELVGTEVAFCSNMSALSRVLELYEGELVELSKQDTASLNAALHKSFNKEDDEVEESGIFSTFASIIFGNRSSAPQKQSIQPPAALAKAHVNVPLAIGRYKFLSENNVFKELGNWWEITENNFEQKLEQLYQIIISKTFIDYLSKMGVLTITYDSFNLVVNSCEAKNRNKLTAKHADILADGKYTIMPIQRLMRYKLLIEEINKTFEKKKRNKSPRLEALLQLITASTRAVNSINIKTDMANTLVVSQEAMRAINQQLELQQQLEAIRAEKQPTAQELGETIKKLELSGSFDEDLKASFDFTSLAKQAKKQPTAAEIAQSMRTVLSPKQPDELAASTIQQSATGGIDLTKQPIVSNTNAQLSEQSKGTSAASQASLNR